MPIICRCEDTDQVAKHLYMETDALVQLHAQLYQQMVNYKRWIVNMVVEQKKAKEEKEKLEQRMVEHDQQWKRRFDKVITNKKDAWKTAMEDHD